MWKLPSNLALLALIACAGPFSFPSLARAADATPGETTAETPSPYAEIDDDYVELIQMFADALDQVDRNYVEKLDRRKLIEAAIRGVITELDPHSTYIPQEELARFRTNIDQQFGGIGIQIDARDGQLIISSPLVGGPAYDAGIGAGDRILEINGQSTKGMNLDAAIEHLKGEPGETVSLVIYHPAEFKTETLELEREMIQLQTVLGDQRLENNDWDYIYDHDQKIAYVRITIFSRNTAEEFAAVLEKLKADGIRGLVLDLRSNPGGLLSAAIEISDRFISDGKIVSVEGRNTPKREWSAVPDTTLIDVPVAVLIDHFSASASEIVSACLQDHDRAVVIGQRSWGKGSVQNIINLEEGKSAMKLTTASYHRPSGKNIHRLPDAKDSDEWGVSPSPDMEVKMTPKQLTTFQQYRRLRDMATLIPHPPAPEPPLSEVDPVLAKGLEYIESKIAEPAQP
ncbi:S41 family peptidase [Blastopirellula sp. JC732]|uniref:S41 family peptidase n=1 Tax=Blastopirellula sediminis TaxID=2894196 RepID=A0A9X1MI42_9BACT|nr:S41 family peptidase [Blastopirellula sediminis]MCC9609601.1 S41 family peptidase [Blastopirellula sediminis]MCC9627623.1 S41 family peptidase [Blastopirellula sediminis]